MHVAFENAGNKPGLQIWRIENFEPVACPEKDFGKFYTGDSYIILHSTGKEGSYGKYNIHFWLGESTTQDEAGAAAILSVELDDSLGGAPIQHREVQNHESDLFISYFQNGVKYLNGGVASGFQHAEINAVEGKKLYQVKGKKNVRVTQVELDVSSMNKGDCFILDEGKEIYVYIGSEAKRAERIKAINVANQIRDQDHNGRAHVNIIDESSTAEEICKFFECLGSGSQDDVAECPEADDDEAFENRLETEVALYKVSDASGEMTLEQVYAQPLTQSCLVTDDCFILDTCNSGIYVWIGKKGTAQEKIEALNYAKNFLESNNYPSWTSVTRVVEGAESTAFKQFFDNWK